MPSVPRYESRVQQAGIPQVSSSANVPDAAFGDSQPGFEMAKKLGGQLVKIGQEDYEQANKIAVEEAYVKALDRKNDLLLNPENGVMTKKGKNAFGVIKEYMPMYEKDLNDIEGELQNDDQRALFRAYKLTNLKEFNNKLQAHVFTETRKFEVNHQKALHDKIGNDAALNYRTSGKIATAQKQRIAAIERLAEINGVSDEEKSNLVLKSNTELHDGVLHQMVAEQQDKTASGYLESVKNQMDADSYAKWKEKLDTGSTLGVAQRTADEAANRFESLADAREWMKNQNLSPEERRLADAQIQAEFRLKDDSARLAHEKFVQDTLVKVQSDPRGLGAMSTNDWIELSPTERKAVVEAIKGFPKETDSATYIKYLGMKSDDMKGMKLEELYNDARPKLSERDWTEIKNKWVAAQRLKTGDPKAKEAYYNFESSSDLVESTARSLGMLTSGQTLADGEKTKPEELHKLKYALSEEVNRIKKDKKPTPEEFEQARNNIIKKSVVVGYKGLFSSTPKRKSTLTQLTESEKEAAIIPYDEINPGYKKYYERKIKEAMGLNPNMNTGSAGVVERQIVQRAAALAELGNYKNEQEVLDYINKAVKKVQP